MFRIYIRILATDQNYRGVAKSIGKFAFGLALLWFISFPYLSRGHFTSENALDAVSVDTKFELNHGLKPQYARIKAELDTFKTGDTLKQTKYFIEKELS